MKGIGKFSKKKKNISLKWSKNVKELGKLKGKTSTIFVIEKELLFGAFLFLFMIGLNYKCPNKYFHYVYYYYEFKSM